MTVEVQGVDAHYRFSENPAWDAFCDHNLCARGYALPGMDLGPFLKFSLYGEIREPTVAGLFDGSEEEIRRIDTSRAMGELAECTFRVAVDVDNPFYGSEGAAYVFAPQKGATPEMVRQLDRGLQHFSTLVLQEKGIDLQQIPGSGAAGGLGGACRAFLGAELMPGIEMVLQQLDFDRLLADADLVITGEGRIDRQTLRGKVVAGVARHARERGIPVIALTGNATDLSPALYDMGMTACFSIHPAPVSLEKAMEAEYARENVRKTVEEMMRVVKATKYFKTERINPKIIKTA